MDTDLDLALALHQVAGDFSRAATNLALGRREEFETLLKHSLVELDTFMDRKAAAE